MINLIQKVLFITPAVFLFLFTFWRKLKEDYTRNQIFTTAFYALIGLVAGSLIASYFAREWWFWIGFVGYGGGVIIGILRYKLRFFETLEAVTFGGLFILMSAFLYNWFLSPEISSAVGAGVILFLIIVFVVLGSHYKRFTWYRSGKVGFSGLVVLGLFFLIRSLVALAFDSVLSFVGAADAIISGVLAFTSFLLLFNLARQTP